MYCVSTSTSTDCKTITTVRATVLKYAEQWKTLDARLCDQVLYREFRNVSERLSTCLDQNTFVVHESCSTTFRTRLKRKISQGKKLSPLNFANDEDHEIENNQDMGEKRKSRRSLDDSIERVCFVCDKANDVSLSYNGVGRCSESSAEINMKHAKDIVVN